MKANTIEEVKPQFNYSLRDTCQILDVSVKKLYTLRIQGVIRYYIRKADKQIRIKGSEIIKFYNS